MNMHLPDLIKLQFEGKPPLSTFLTRDRRTIHIYQHKISMICDDTASFIVYQLELLSCIPVGIISYASDFMQVGGVDGSRALRAVFIDNEQEFKPVLLITRLKQYLIVGFIVVAWKLSICCTQRMAGEGFVLSRFNSCKAISRPYVVCCLGSLLSDLTSLWKREIQCCSLKIFRCCINQVVRKWYSAVKLYELEQAVSNMKEAVCANQMLPCWPRSLVLSNAHSVVNKGSDQQWFFVSNLAIGIFIFHSGLIRNILLYQAADNDWLLIIFSSTLYQTICHRVLIGKKGLLEWYSHQLWIVPTTKKGAYPFDMMYLEVNPTFSRLLLPTC